jgi:hypothetical protein
MGSKGAGNWYLSCTIFDCIRVESPREVIDMSYRTFVDRDGAYWQVWDSQPTKVERRVTGGSDRRRHKSHAWHGLERRTGQDRRMTSQRRITLSEGYGASQRKAATHSHPGPLGRALSARAANPVRKSQAHRQGRREQVALKPPRKKPPRPAPCEWLPDWGCTTGFALGAPTNPYLLLTGKPAVRQRLRAILRDPVVRDYDLRGS